MLLRSPYANDCTVVCLWSLPNFYYEILIQNHWSAYVFSPSLGFKICFHYKKQLHVMTENCWSFSSFSSLVSGKLNCFSIQHILSSSTLIETNHKAVQEFWPFIVKSSIKSTDFLQQMYHCWPHSAHPDTLQSCWTLCPTICFNAQHTSDD